VRGETKKSEKGHDNEYEAKRRKEEIDGGFRSEKR
jgi:hypothetical protein